MKGRSMITYMKNIASHHSTWLNDAHGVHSSSETDGMPWLTDTVICADMPRESNLVEIKAPLSCVQTSFEEELARREER